MAHIYKIKDKENGKVYIGQTGRSIKQRVLEHSRGYQTPFDRVMKKKGIDAFEYVELEECDEVEALKREAYWIKHYNAVENGYNVKHGRIDGRLRYYEVDDEFLNIYLEFGKDETRKRYWAKVPGHRLTEIFNQHPDIKFIDEECWNAVYCPELDITFPTIRHCAEKLVLFNYAPTKSSALRGVYRVLKGDTDHYKNLTFETIL